jgi:hypothetical protein
VSVHAPSLLAPDLGTRTDGTTARAVMRRGPHHEEKHGWGGVGAAMHATVLGCRWVLAWFGEVAVVVFVIIHNKQLGQRRIDVLVLPCLIVRSWSPNSGIHLGHLQQRPGKMASKSEFGGGPENFGPQFHISSPARPPISAPKTVGPTYADSALVSPTLCRARPCRRRALLRTE